jgi:hypothetical protein
VFWLKQMGQLLSVMLQVHLQAKLTAGMVAQQATVL